MGDSIIYASPKQAQISKFIKLICIVTFLDLLPLKFLLGSKFKEVPIKRGRGRPPKPKDPLTDMEKNDGAVATRGRPAVKDISTNWHCIENKVKI